MQHDRPHDHLCTIDSIRQSITRRCWFRRSFDRLILEGAIFWSLRSKFVGLLPSSWRFFGDIKIFLTIQRAWHGGEKSFCVDSCRKFSREELLSGRVLHSKRGVRTKVPPDSTRFTSKKVVFKLRSVKSIVWSVRIVIIITRHKIISIWLYFSFAILISTKHKRYLDVLYIFDYFLIFIN